jgi:hypothetical protein
MEWLRKTTKSLARMTGVPAKIQTRHLPNMSQQCYCYTDLFPPENRRDIKSNMQGVSGLPVSSPDSSSSNLLESDCSAPDTTAAPVLLFTLLRAVAANWPCGPPLGKVGFTVGLTPDT